jgi:hypothetical protein
MEEGTCYVLNYISSGEYVMDKNPETLRKTWPERFKSFFSLGDEAYRQEYQTWEHALEHLVEPSSSREMWANDTGDVCSGLLVHESDAG